MKKRIVSLLLALVMMTSLLPVQVFAEAVDTAAEQPVVEQPVVEQPVVEQQQEEKREDAPEQEPVQEPEQEPVTAQQTAGTAFAAEETPKYVITSNVEWASDKTDTTKPYLRLKNGKKWIEGGDGTPIDATQTQIIQIAVMK